jgi:hypothetical protein
MAGKTQKQAYAGAYGAAASVTKAAAQYPASASRQASAYDLLRRQGLSAEQIAKRLAAQKAPKVVVASQGDTFDKLAEKLGVNTQDLIKENPETTYPRGGEVLNVPPKYLAPDFGTAEPSKEGIVYPENMNPALFADYITSMGLGEYNVPGVGDYYGKDLFQGVATDEGLYAAVNKFREGYGGLDARRFRTGQYGTQYGLGQTTTEEVQALQKQLDVGKYYQENMFEMSGMPLKYRYRQNEQGQWVDRGKEAYFDALYEANGIDPKNSDEVEAFWSYADDDLLFMGEFFDIIEWPQGGGYGGYGALPTPYTQYRSGQKPTFGDYATYLSLTSWSI